MGEIADKMASAMVHRGPDSGGVWADSQIGLALAHRRLSIIDLSAAGRQPMHSEHGQYIIVFNGEIYNHRELRRELSARGKIFRGHSDTEVILAGCEEWGIEQTIKKCAGMFAIALWDVHERQLYLIRDRMGEKPLYYGWQGRTFLFSSELKAMRTHPDFHADIDIDSLTLYFRHRYIPAPYSIYRNVHKLEPGTILTLPVGALQSDQACGRCRKQRYWSLKEIVEKAESDPYSGTPGEAVCTLEALLAESVGGQMVADVPLGAFLSGGIDSSTIVALMQSLSTEPVNTFTIGYEERGHNEAVYAREIAMHLGCHHTELYVTPKQAIDVIPSMSQIYDEPFADPSQIPTYLVSQLARRYVTVSLSGDGGDELFYGYGVYRMLFKRWNIARRIRIRNALIQDGAAKLTQWLFHPSPKQLAVVKSLLAAKSHVDVYRSMISVCHDPCGLVLGSHELGTILSREELRPNVSSKEGMIMALDALSYLPDDVLVKVDRAAMACSLETRIPLLDHRIVEFAFRLPFDIKFRDGITKWPLRQILHKHVPRDLVERPKKGFGIPIALWLRHELREWANDLLDDKTIREDGVLNFDHVRQYLKEHTDERQDHSGILWALLMFQSWLHNGQGASTWDGRLHGRTGTGESVAQKMLE